MIITMATGGNDLLQTFFEKPNALALKRTRAFGVVEPTYGRR